MWIGNRFFRSHDLVVLVVYPLISLPLITSSLMVVKIETTALIWFTATTIIVMIWQSLRQTPHIVILPSITINGVKKGSGSMAFERPTRIERTRQSFKHWAIRRPLLVASEFEPMQRYVATFDIGNVGLVDVALHEYSVEKEDPSPPQRVIESNPLLDDKRQRKILHKGERITGQFDLQVDDDCLTVFRIDIISVGLAASRRLYVLKQGHKLQYFDAHRTIGLNREKIERTLLANP